MISSQNTTVNNNETWDVVMQGVTIGKNPIVSTDAVVTRCSAKYYLVSDIPSKIIKIIG